MADHHLLRIGIVLDDTLDRPDGVQQYVLTLGSWLADQGHAVFYLVGNTTRQDIMNVYSLARTVKVSFNANVLAIPLPVSKYKAANLLKELRLDVLHVQIPYSPFLAGKIISCAQQEAVVGTFHVLPYGRAARAGTRLLGALQRKSLKAFDRIAATSPASATFARVTYGVEAVVVPNPVDVGYFKKTARSSQRKDNNAVRIVFLGRLVERKGALHLLRALVELRKLSSTQLEVRIGGKGPLLDKLKRYAAAHKLHDIVHFDGFIAEEAKPAYLGAADIAVFPAMSGESFGIVLTEAMAAGAGVVMGGNNPGYQSVLGAWPECLVNARSPQEFAHSLIAILSDSPLQRRVHEQQQGAVKQYDTPVVGNTMLGIYRHAILQRAGEV